MVKFLFVAGCIFGLSTNIWRKSAASALVYCNEGLPRQGYFNLCFPDTVLYLIAVKLLEYLKLHLFFQHTIYSLYFEKKEIQVSSRP